MRTLQHAGLFAATALLVVGGGNLPVQSRTSAVGSAASKQLQHRAYNRPAPTFSEEIGTTPNGPSTAGLEALALIGTALIGLVPLIHRPGKRH